MEESPFPYQGPLEPAQVRGRDDLIADLIERVTGHRVTALLGPRRYGKTSVLRRVADDLREVSTVWVDLYEVTSPADVAVRFDDGLAAARGPVVELASRLALTLSLNLGLVKVALSGPARNRPDPSTILHSLLAVLVKAALATPTLLVIDEFSSIARVDGAAGAMRTALQQHYRDLGLIFAGSQPSMMRALFSDRPQPFYGQADLVEIGTLTPAAVAEVVGEGFAGTGRSAGRLAGLIFEFAGGHPQRAMQLADACWARTPPGSNGEEAWPDGLTAVRRSSADAMERLYSRCTTGEQAVLRSVARSGSVYGAEATLLDLAKGTARHARQALLDRGELVVTDSGLRIVDPILSDWVRYRFPL